VPAQFQCPFCGQPYTLTDEQLPIYSGKTIACTQCKQEFTLGQFVPSASPATGRTEIPAPAPMAQPMQPLGQPPIAQYGGYYAQRSNGIAIASVVCGAMGFVIPLIGGLLGIIFGIIGLRKTRDPSVGGKGLAITGLSLGAASLLLSGCMMSILLPSLNRARETANRVKCASNMRIIGQALLLYANQNHGAYPPKLEDLITAQLIDGQPFVCPSTNDTVAPGIGNAQATNLSAGGHLSYVYIGQKLSPSSPADQVLVCELPSNHNNDGGNFLFADGHVEFFNGPNVQKMIANLKAGKNPPLP
jgi:predicted Zn finger-like uncharacterized protein/prepilin-type processing-associated H-X9-DG protein